MAYQYKLSDVSQLTIRRPLRSGHLDIKDAQCAETKDVLKKLYRAFDTWASRMGVMGAQKFNFLHKWPNLQGRLTLTLNDF